MRSTRCIPAPRHEAAICDSFSAGISIDREVQRLVEPGDDHVALVAEHHGVAVGVASYEILNGTQAEIALLVDDAWQGDGIGRCTRASWAAYTSDFRMTRPYARRT